MALEKIEALTPDQAVQAFNELPVPDPQGIATPETLAAAGEAFEFFAAGGSCRAVIRKNGGQLWIEAASGKAADDLTAIGLELAEEVAKQAQCQEVSFQTCRAGLMKKATQHGYQVAGWILKKDIRCGSAA
jgi:hypothetical protein